MQQSLFMRAACLLILICCGHFTSAQKNYFKLFKIEFNIPNQQVISFDHSKSFEYARLDLSNGVFDIPAFPQYNYKLLSRTLTSGSSEYKKFEGNAMVGKQKITYKQEEFYNTDRNVFTFYLSNGGTTVFFCSITPYNNDKIDLDDPYAHASDSLDSNLTQKQITVLEYAVQEVRTKFGGKEQPLINLKGKDVKLTFDLDRSLVLIPASKSALKVSNLRKVADDEESIMYKGTATDSDTKWNFTYYLDKKNELTIFDIESLNEKGTSMAYLCKGPLGQNSQTSIEPKTQYQASGTGFFLTPDGIIATNAHVVDDLNSISVTVNYGSNSKTYSAKVIAKDIDHDLALLKVTDQKFIKPNKIPYALSTNTDVGEKVFTIGYPLDDIMGNNFKLMDGIVNSLTGMADDQRYLQISIPLLPGNSGGPLFNSKGEIIGLTSARLEGQKIGIQINNVGYAIKTQYLINLLRERSITGYTITSQLEGLQLKDQVKQIKNYVVIIRGTID